MTNAELLTLLHEGHTLTREAYLHLKLECQKRGIDPELLDEANNNLIEIKKERIRTHLDNANKKFMAAIWAFAFAQKLEGVDDDHLKYGLMQKRLSEEEADYIIGSLEEKSTEALNDADNHRWQGVIKMICGVAILAIAFQVGLGNNAYGFGAIVLAIGFVEMAASSVKASRYHRILDNLQAVPPEAAEAELPAKSGGG